MIPEDIRDDVARVVRSVVMPSGGLCWVRALVGKQVLNDLGLEARVQVGSMIYRAGADPLRDVVAFCGPGNIGRVDHQGFLAHVWLSVGDDLVDFSSGDWCMSLSEVGPELEPIQWQAVPPDYHWAPRDTFMAPWRNRGEPDLGLAWYGPLAMHDGTRERIRDAYEAAVSDMEEQPALLYCVRRNLDILQIKQRLLRRAA